MYQNYIFDLYGTLVDIHTNEKKAYLWKKMSLFFGMKGAAYEPKELRTAYETKIKEQEAALRMECHGSHVPEIDIADVFRQLLEEAFPARPGTGSVLLLKSHGTFSPDPQFLLPLPCCAADSSPWHSASAFRPARAAF